MAGRIPLTVNSSSLSLEELPSGIDLDVTGSNIISTSTSAAILNTGVTTLNIGGAATTVSIGAATGTLTINNANTVITGNLTVNGTTTTINSTTLSVDDILVELGTVATPTDTTAAGGGIVLKGATDKSITWSSTNGWTSTEEFNLESGKQYKINGTSVLSATTLGSGVTGSSLTSVGTITTGTWSATNIALGKGGTNASLTAVNGGIVYSNASAMAITAAGTAGQALLSAGAAAPVWTTLSLTDLPDAWTKKSVRVATTANITLSGTQTIDGIAVVAGDRVLVKDQTTASQNGIYIVAAGAWTRSTDADTVSKLAGACVNVDSGTANGGFRFDTDLKATDTLDTTALYFFRIYDTGDSATANTANKLVLRDASGNFSAGTITAALSGNASTATTLQTARNINGVSFNGSADITITAAAGTLTGTTLNSTVVSSSLTSVGTITSGTWSGSFGAVSGANLTNLTAGNLSGTIPSAVLGNSTAYVGTTAVALNRASANQALTGISSVTLPGSTSGSVQIIPTAAAGTGTVLTLPATTGTVVTTGDSGTVTSTMIADGTIVNGDISASASIAISKLAASTISGVSLGSNLNTLTLNVSGTGLSGSTTYNGSAAATFTVTSNATNANTASTIVARDASGNFSAGTITATLSGTATQVSNSLTLAVSGTGLSGSATFNGASAQTFTVTSNATSANTASTIVARDASGNFTAGTITVSGISNSGSTQEKSLGVGTAASGTAGEIRATNAITSYYSDDRLKTRKGNIKNALEKVKALNGFHYEANEVAQSLGYEVKPEVGVSAQEVQMILPEIVVPAPISDRYLTVHYEKLIPLLIEAIKEQQVQIEELKAKLGN